MVYRYGRKGAIELTWPETPMHPTRAFSAAVVGDGGMSGDYVRFSRRGVTYTLYSITISGRGDKDGLVTARGKSKLSDLACKGFALGDDAWKLMYSAKLPVDESRSIEPR